MSSVIQVNNLSKRYRLGLKEKEAETLISQIGSAILSPFQNFKKLRELSRFGEENESVFWALKDIDFEVNEGEVLGIIGKNGAGKSTLLKILSQITEPTSGKIEIRGRVASLLEVGTGFHPELSGRDNIYMNGTILGMTRKEIDKKLDEIIDFSGIEKFIDTPVKFYSSGMKVRLGFSVAAHLDPEILIIDEVLAVGDFEFQAKCLGKMEEVSKHGRTVLFVSHNLGAVSSLCTRAILLENGKVSEVGDVNKVLNVYQKKVEKYTSISFLTFNGTAQNSLIFSSVHLNDKDPFQSFILVSPDDVLKIEIKSKTNVADNIKVTIALFKDGVRIFSVFDQSNRKFEAGRFLSEFEIPSNFLRPGVYTVGLGGDYQSGEWMWCDQAFSFEVLEVYSKNIDKPAVGLINAKQLIKTSRVTE
ncbi:ABC transporter ATP-binding protein [Algoriphagus yeomjeoni]|uniref:Lipopolysaccharide transport system ATP-binding protein n=1 Tax=Algoriphagus yeomjeoni TaxID=291403 RepID=A0A327P6N0_9BACT|nr:ABC transporter ATP-binding protein [Algoriphagus yeomjeoni]RAI85586.1 lipopolysaccharide transport system ATP-binding protein [Algoriphagus yeomjeoni]